MQSASDLAADLAAHADEVCREYLSNGRRQGSYWLVGNLANHPGRSLFVRLTGPARGTGAAGRWTDAATGQHGDLLDLIRETCRLTEFADVADEARRFLHLPKPEGRPKTERVAPGSPDAARRLFAMARPIRGTLAETYLDARGIADLAGTDWLRFHPTCYYRPDRHSPTETWPALIAAVTDTTGTITGVHRTWLDPDGFSRASLGKAPVDTPRRALGRLRGGGVRFGIATDILAAGEGIETVLSVRQALPDLPGIAALSAAHLAAIDLSPALRRLYVLRDVDPAGDAAEAALTVRTKSLGIELIPLIPSREDFNEDLMAFGSDGLRHHLQSQLAPEDVARFLPIGVQRDRTG
ncbi:toprim domain-containing protein [Jannaschia sp. S6380]|uniref:DUF7146 domain-containing protein n=1 Tax=Jannaschia sp. S6380 TaxID=2926408 RepID=UPI001FF18077|nr:toprim domain-containing protein [Jannaschia sp. S6380]MCK0166241.1 toprim domain-containing protein [Jannaschia sp. S6380]